MNSWPTLKMWGEFIGALALETLILYAVAKLVASRVSSAQWQRAMWQMAAIAMLLALIGELNGIRAWLPRPGGKMSEALPTGIVTVTLKDPEPSAVGNLPQEWSNEFKSAPVPQPAPVPLWQKSFSWPAVLMLSVSSALLLRLAMAQLLTLAFRRRARRCCDAELCEVLGRIARLMGVRRAIVLARSGKTDAPFTFGVWRPVIVLPHLFNETFTLPQREAALAHEVAHVAGFDSAWRTLSCALCALLWWSPFAWLAKRELERVSEFAADEASLLFADGPNHLADCLVLCAKVHRRPLFTAWLGMDGGHFRSALGKRVSRLLHVRAHQISTRRMPGVLRFVAPLLCVAAIWFSASLFTSQDADPRSWKHSLLGSAFAAVAVEVPSTKPAHDRSVEVARLVQNGKIFYEAGRLAEAEAALQSALELEPTNQAALYYFNLAAKRASLVETQLLVVEQQWVSSLQTSAKPSEARTENHEKLQSIQFKDFGPIDNLPLSEVVQQLRQTTQRLDPDHKGINFTIRASGRDADTDSGIGGTTIHLGSALANITLEEVLNVIVTAASRKLQYTIEDDAVVISAGQSPSGDLRTRFFKIDPNGFDKALKTVASFGPQSRGDQRAFDKAFETNAPIVRFQQLVQRAGVDLTQAGKALFYNDRLGVLMVKATDEDLETIEKVVQLLNMSPPQLTIHVMAMEVPVSAAADGVLRFGLAARFSTNAPPQDAFTNSGRPALQGVLTPSQFQSFVQTLEMAGGTDLLKAPEVTTQSGRRAQIKVVDIRYVVTGLDYGTNGATKKSAAETNGVSATGASPDNPRPITEPFELGPIVDVVPYVETDGYTIRMTVSPKLREFLGYDEPPKPTWATGGPYAPPDRNLSQPVPMPKFRLRETTATARVRDGQTLVLGAGAARHVTVDKNAGTTTNYADKALFFFITPRLVDLAGNRLHSEDELKKFERREQQNMEGKSSLLNGGERNVASPRR